MAAVPQRGSKPEMTVRRLVHGMGYRYRLHVRGLSGTPDLVFPRLRKIVFVHGCFWHRHNCTLATTPGTNTCFWRNKFAANVARDSRNMRDLRAEGWSVFIVWQCETRDTAFLRSRLKGLLQDAVGTSRYRSSKPAKLKR